MPKQPSRPGAKKDDLDLIPPEEIRARRIRLFVFLGAIAACVLGVAIYFGARPIGGAIKAWQARRLARQAFALIDRKQWNEANTKARDAYLLRPSEPESWRAIARLCYRTRKGTAALEWWKKVDDANRLTLEDRRDYVGAALMAGELPIAAKREIFRVSSEKGMSMFVYETERPHLNEAALIAGTNPELDIPDAQRSNRAREKQPAHDSVLQRALDVVTSLEIYQKR